MTVLTSEVWRELRGVKDQKGRPILVGLLPCAGDGGPEMIQFRAKGTKATFYYPLDKIYYKSMTAAAEVAKREKLGSKRIWSGKARGARRSVLIG